MGEMAETIREIGKDVLISLVVLGIILGSLYLISGRWPPMVVVESGSMMHSEESQIGVIDPGDIVLVQERDKEDITTYVEGKATGYRQYGQYGDVIIFEPDGNKRKTPIIHRAVLYLEENDSVEGSFDVPSLKQLDYGTDWHTSEGDYLGIEGTLTLYDYGYKGNDLRIDLSDLNQGGYITKGDNNDEIDQQQGHINPISSEPIKQDWIKGRARGELPWFGIIKLVYLGRTEYIPNNTWNYFMLSIAILLLFPLVTEIGSNIYDEMVEGEGRKERETQSGENSDEITTPKNEGSSGNGENLESEMYEEKENDDDTDAIEDDDKLEP
ncbi:MAG: S26 family signal peptidase [Candidatus Thermoplasmatota archaeon]